MTEYCNTCDNDLIRIPNSVLFPECFYCEKCDKFYHKRLVPISEKSFEQFNVKRRGELKELAMICKGRAKVSREDLITLGYL